MKQTIYRNAKFLSLDKKVPVIKAMLVTDGTITAMSEDFILTELAPDAEVRDLKGATLLPAFIEVHSHLISRARHILAEKSDSGSGESDTDTLIETIGEASAEYLSNGFTTVCEANAGLAEYQLLQTANQRGYLKTDVILYLTPDAASELLPRQMAMDNPYTGHIRLAGCCLELDGCAERNTAWLEEPYANRTDGGSPLKKDSYVQEVFQTCIQNHWQIAVHAAGDAAIEQLIRCYRQALCNVNGTKTDADGNAVPKIYEDLRPLLLHAQTLTDKQIARMQPLGIVPSFFLDGIYRYGDTYEAILGKERAERVFPLRSAVKRGLAFTMYHGEPADSIFSFYSACSRVTASGQVLGEEQTINSDQAVNSLTIFAAYQIFEDLYKGSLTPGKRADFVVLDSHPLELSDAKLADMNVLMTVKDDEVVYERKG